MTDVTTLLKDPVKGSDKAVIYPSQVSLVGGGTEGLHAVSANDDPGLTIIFCDGIPHEFLFGSCQENKTAVDHSVIVGFCSGKCQVRYCILLHSTG